MGAFANIKAALSRIEEFLDEPELIKYVRPLDGEQVEDVRIHNACLSWDSGDSTKDLQITLKNINISVKPGILVPSRSSWFKLLLSPVHRSLLSKARLSSWSVKWAQANRQYLVR